MGIGRVVGTGAAVVAGLGLLGACGWDIAKEEAIDETKVTDEFTSVLFDNSSGNVFIRTGDEPSVSRVVHHDDEPPGASHRVEDGVLILDACPVDDCWIDYEVVVPAGVTVNGAVGSGDVEVAGAGAANIQAGSGNVTLRDVDGAVNVDIRSGDADLFGIGGRAQVTAASGNVTVRLADPADVRVEARSGNIDVAVPAGDYEVDASAGSGDVDNTIDSVEGAAHRVELHASSGDVMVARI